MGWSPSGSRPILSAQTQIRADGIEEGASSATSSRNRRKRETNGDGNSTLAALARVSQKDRTDFAPALKVFTTTAMPGEFFSRETSD